MPTPDSIGWGLSPGSGAERHPPRCVAQQASPVVVMSVVVREHQSARHLAPDWSGVWLSRRDLVTGEVIRRGVIYRIPGPLGPVAVGAAR